MQQHGLKAKTKRRLVVTTDSRHHLPVAPGLVKRNFNPPEPNRLWRSWRHHISTDEGRLYLASVVDFFSRQIVGWILKGHMQASLSRMP